MICPECGTEFEQRTYNHKYCCKRCYNSVTKRRWLRTSRKARDAASKDKKKRYYKRKKLGVCVRCENPVDGTTYCSLCNESRHR